MDRPTLAFSPVVNTAAERHGVSFKEAFGTWMRVALLSFGGPAGQIAVMHRIIVEEKRWIGERRFLHALNYCMLLPGPEAHQLAVYIGWLLHRTLGGIVAGTLFVVPGVVCLGTLSWTYAAYGDIGVVQGLFFGLKAAVLAIVLEAVVRVGRRALKTSVMVALAGLSFVAIFFFAIPFPIIIVAAALIGFIGHLADLDWFERDGGHGSSGEDGDGSAAIDKAFAEKIPLHVQPSVYRLASVLAVGLALWLGPLLALLVIFGPDNVFTAITAFNAKMAVVTFGGAYAVLAYMAQQAVESFHWLKPDEMLVGLGFAETTPGPLISVVQFVGFMAAFRNPGALSPGMAGTIGGLLAMWATFVPSFLWIFAGAPYIEALHGNKALASTLSAITASVVGVILNLAVWFSLHTLFRDVMHVAGYGLNFDAPVLMTINPSALLLSVASVIAVFWFKAGMIYTFLACSVGGLAFYLLGLV